MISLKITSFIPVPTKKTDQLYVYKLRKVLSYTLLYIIANHFKQGIRLPDFLDKFICLCYTQFHGCFSFFYSFLIKTFLKEKCPFFCPPSEFTQNSLHYQKHNKTNQLGYLVTLLCYVTFHKTPIIGDVPGSYVAWNNGTDQHRYKFNKEFKEC